MRVLLGEPGPLEEMYRAPDGHDGPWLRVNFVSTLDGAAQGEQGRSGDINNAVDKVVFDALRSLADVLVVGAGTLRTEGYDVPALPLVVVTRSGRVPDGLRGAPAGRVMMATVADAPALDDARRELGDEHVLVLGDAEVDLALLKTTLADRGLVEQLCEGGPQLCHAMLAAGVVDELCLTWVPRLIAGQHLGIVEGAPVDVHLAPHLLLEEDGTLLGRWLVSRGGAAAPG